MGNYSKEDIFGLETKLDITPNQAKVICEKYIKDKEVRELPYGPERWLRGVANKIALTEVLYLENISKDELFNGINHKIRDEDTGEEKSSIMHLIHDGLKTHDERDSNYRKFVNKLREVVETNGDAKKIVSYYEDRFYGIMSNWKFLPNSPALMNAWRDYPGLGKLAKENNNQYSACFVFPVEDSVDGWMKTAWITALTHKTGGGCIIKGSRVFTTHCGLEKIETLFEEFSQNKKIVTESNGKWVDISDQNIYTFSFNPTTGEMEKDKVTKVWEFNLSNSNVFKIKTKNNIHLTTSSWHEFFIFEDGIIKSRKAEELKPNDLLILPNRTGMGLWPFKDYRTEEGLKIDEEVAWLLGYFIGDGSIGNSKNGLRLRFHDNNLETIKSALDIVNKKFATKINFIDKDKRSQAAAYVITTTKETVVRKIMKLACVNQGEKATKVIFPKHIIKSPLSVVCSFLAGLLDSDGYIEKNRFRASFNTASVELAKEIACILGILGLKTKIRTRQPRKKYWSLMYEITVSNYDDIIILNELLSPYLKNRFRANRLIEKTKTIGGKTRSYNIKLKYCEEILKKIGINLHSAAIWRSPIKVGEEDFWLHRWKAGKQIGREKFKLLISNILKYKLDKEDKQKLTMYYNIANNIVEIENTEGIRTNEPFYDFTVEKNNNYLAGDFGLAIIHNTGFSAARVRPKGDTVKTTQGVASGALSIFNIVDAVTEEIKQGSVRRGANMGILPYHHPDIIDFINMKAILNNKNSKIYNKIKKVLEENYSIDEKNPKDKQILELITKTFLDEQLRNFNISVGLDQKFFKAVKEDSEYELINPHTKKVVGKKKAREVFDLIVKHAWETGDPGYVMLDIINDSESNPTPKLGQIESTNPCGEKPLLPNEPCNLGSLNVAKFVKYNNGKSYIDYKDLEETTKLATIFLDDVIDVNNYPTDEVEIMAKGNRRIGLGIMGWAEMLVLLGIPYDSEEALKLGGEVMGFIEEKATEQSIELAKRKGVFPFYKDSIFDKDGEYFKGNELKPRNCVRTTIAPTGTISNCAGLQGAGIEPFYSLAYDRLMAPGQDQVERGEKIDDKYIMHEFNPLLEKSLEENNYFGLDKKTLWEKIEKNHGSIKGLNEIPENIQRLFRTAHDINYEWHIKHQVVFQKNTGDGVSKTINFPNSATLDDIRNAYLLAAELSLKGITIYRDGCKSIQTLISHTDKKEKLENLLDKERPNVIGTTVKFDSPFGKGFLTYNIVGGKSNHPYETFINVGKAGGDIQAISEGYGRLMSMLLKKGVKIEEIIEQLAGIGGNSQIGHGENNIKSLPDAIAIALGKAVNSIPINGVQQETQKKLTTLESDDLCNRCGARLKFEEGCKKCTLCDWSGCP